MDLKRFGGNGIGDTVIGAHANAQCEHTVTICIEIAEYTLATL